MGFSRRRLYGRQSRVARIAVFGAAVALTGTLLGTSSALAATPGLAGQASPSDFPVGVAIFDVATLSGGANPTGTIVFDLYAPGDTECRGPAIFSSTKTVAGNGRYQSDSYSTVAAGRYQWVARYSGDGANTPVATVCGTPSQAVSVSRRQTTLTHQALLPTLAGEVRDTAVLSNGSGPGGPTGTITFRLYGPANVICAAPPVFVDTVPVAGNGAYTSAPFTPTAPGNYQWLVSYSGDAHNLPSNSYCADPAGTTVVLVRVPPATVRAIAPATGRPGRPLTAEAALEGGVLPSGGIAFLLFGPDDPQCVGPHVFGSTVTALGSGLYRSAPFVPSVPGRYRWVVRYSGDLANAPASSPCGAPGSITVVPQVPGDYDGDGDTDVAIYRSGEGNWYVRGMDPVQWGAPADVPVPGDYDGDGDTDVAVYRPGEGAWYLRGIGLVRWGGAPGDVPVPADYDGDGDTDVAIFRPGEGTWYVTGADPVQWGAPGDVPVPADYDGDGDTDVAVYRPREGAWYLRGIGLVRWGGAPGDVPVPGDYDGDGDTDVAIFRPGAGGWYVAGLGGAGFGGPGDVPVPGDYDGDDDTDVAVYRPATGGWHVFGGQAVAWGGLPGDIPLSLPAAVRQAIGSGPPPA